MSTLFRYIVPAEETQWKFPASGEVCFTWDYDARSDELLKLYSKGKQEQWDADTRIDWSLPVDPEDPMQMDDQVVPLYGTPLWNKLSPKHVSSSSSREVRRVFTRSVVGPGWFSEANRAPAPDPNRAAQRSTSHGGNE